MMTEHESRAWRPELTGWSDDVLPAYREFAKELPNPCSVVEVGSAHGRSAIFLAQELVALGHGSHSKIYMVDDWGGGWFAECLPSIVKHAAPRELELLRPVRATSRKAVDMFERHSLDMIFIDGDHSRIGCAADLNTWCHRVTPVGIFAGHDFDEQAHPGVVAAVRDFISSAGTWRTQLGDASHPMMASRSVWRLL